MDLIVLGAIAIGGLLTVSANIYGWFKLSNERFNFANYNFYLPLIILVIVGTILNYIGIGYIKLLILISMQFLLYYFFVSKDLVKCISSVIVMQGILMISELIVALVGSIFIGDYINLFMKQPIGILTLNFFVTILLLMFVNFNFVKKLYHCLISVFDKMRKNNLILCCVATIILSIVFMIMSYIELPKAILLLLNSMLVLIYVGIVIGLMFSQEKYHSINSKYETSISSLREYEDIMDKYRIDNHENKNQLLTIRNMIKANDKTTEKYIDKLVKNKIKDNENIFYKTSKIPEGGLRATVYSKLCKMNEAKIDYVLDIANDVKTVDLISLSDDAMLNACKIIGVFLDNAIEAVENLKKKNVLLEIYTMDGYLHFDISNNYEGVIELDKIANKGYTTKGKGHGYGLSLVDEIIDEDSSLENEKKINRDLFTQILKIKM